jgi:hypothetical protein
MQVKQQQFIAARWFHQAIAWVKEGSPDHAGDAGRTWTAERRRRKRAREPFQAVLTVYGRLLPVQGIDLHEFGAGVLSPMSIEPGTNLFIDLKSKGVVGFAYVRHCTERGKGHFAIGLEFPTELMPRQPGDWNYTRVSAS